MGNSTRDNFHVDVSTVLMALDVEITGQRGDWADALCPIHLESDPSFTVNLDHGGWSCFHGEKGQLISLIAKVKGISWGEAKKWAESLVKPDVGSEALMAKLFPQPVESEVPAWTKRFEELSTSTMTEYWFERGFTVETMRLFDVRYDAEEEELVWPVKDADGEILGFVKRRLPGYRKKYLYPRGFNRALFPLDHVQGTDIILVEGPLDAMWLHQHGYTGALAMLGSDLTQGQQLWMRRGQVEKVTLVLDNDETGKRAMQTLAEDMSKYFDMRIVVLSGVKDIQELHEPALTEAMDAARSAISVLFEI